MIRQFLSSVVVALCTCSFAQAQPAGKIPVIGYLSGFKDSGKPGSLDEPFWRRLRERGYAEGKNIRIESRLLEGMTDVYPKLVGELVDLKVDVLVIAGSLSAIQLAKQATKTIPSLSSQLRIR